MTLARLISGSCTVRTALKISAEEDSSIDVLRASPSREAAPPELRKKPLAFVLRRLNLTQSALAEKAGVSVPAVHHATKADDVHLDTVEAIAAALGWKTQDVAEMIVTPVEEMTRAELAAAVAAGAGTLKEKADRLKVADRTLRRWLDGTKPAPAGLKEELAALGWIKPS